MLIAHGGWCPVLTTMLRQKLENELKPVLAFLFPNRVQLRRLIYFTIYKGFLATECTLHGGRVWIDV